MTGSVVDALAALFAGPGGRDYLGEQVSMATHMVQCAALAEAAGEPEPLVVAALVHDVGHLLDRPDGEDRHGEIAAEWLAAWLPEEVTEPVRLHVAAKRYLCATEPAYARALSPASTRSLVVQGGPMDATEVTAFAAGPHAAAAVAVRRYDDAGKDPAVPVPPLEHFLPAVARVAGGSAGPG